MTEKRGWKKIQEIGHSNITNSPPRKKNQWDTKIHQPKGITKYTGLTNSPLNKINPKKLISIYSVEKNPLNMRELNRIK